MENHPAGHETIRSLANGIHPANVSPMHLPAAPRCRRLVLRGVSFFWICVLTFSLRAQTPPTASIFVTNGQRKIQWTPFPAAQFYQIFSGTNLATSFSLDTNGVISGNSFTTAPTNSMKFYLLSVTPMSSNAVLTATVLNRLAYGPTPDELERVLTGTNPIGPQAFIDEQLAPENIVETLTNSHTNIAFISLKFAGATNIVDFLATTNATNGSVAISSTNATISDYRAWFVQSAIGAKRQLLEVLLQFFENHFVTQYSKSSPYLNGFYNGDGGVMEDRIATQWEYLENMKWRQALLNPQCTFYDLLRISAESPAMIVYLDTVNSKGSGSNIANENYARELLELFTFGVDNGYDQNDITVMSRAWTGWSVAKVDVTNTFNPFASALVGVATNTTGVWAFNYKSANHNTTTKNIFITTNGTHKFVPARFGAPWVNRDYSLVLTNGSTTNGIQDGYQVIAHLADQPFTEEFLSVKLCRLFVHDNFAHGYDFTTNTSPEAQLVKACMMAWETNSPKGQIRPVLKTIFDSDLFRGNGAAMQKVKTPLEYTVSTIRAFRTSTNGTFTPRSYSADSDGYAIATTPLSRMGGMLLFDRNDPNGYPEDAQGWISGGTLAERIRFVQSVLVAAGQSGKSDSGNNNTTDPVALLKYKLPVASWTNAPNVADFFIGLLYPGEGAANLDLYRTAAINFLNDGSADSNPSVTPFANLSVSNTAASVYDTRVRGMVSMLLTFQRWQEQ